jgi:hypothetical protein
MCVTSTYETCSFLAFKDNSKSSLAISRVQMIHSVVVIIEICYLGFCSRVSFFLIEMLHVRDSVTLLGNNQWWTKKKHYTEK